MADRSLVLRHGEREFRVTLYEDGRVGVDGETFHVRRRGDGEVRVKGDPGLHAWVARAGDARWVFAQGSTFELSAAPPSRARVSRAGYSGSLTAPMPATVRRVEVRVGQLVARGDTLIVLEAMKMELPVKAEGAGRVEAIRCREGELVEPGEPLVELSDASTRSEPVGGGQEP
ncbi:MAG TPA: biotin/lipoyl-containing protein [Vicinamibacterales bacterium]|nr:biotin/lipoyl-containing protein [Vicinamibacterales bacterium]